MSIVLERREADIDDLAILLPSQQQQLKLEITGGMAYITEQIAYILVISRRRKVSHKQCRPRSDLHFNGVVVHQFLVACLCHEGLILRVELNHGDFRIPISSGEHCDTVDGTALPQS